MGITSLNTFVNSLTAITIAGVNRAYTEGMPDKINPADLPALFARIVEGGDQGLTTKTYGGWPSLICELIIAVELVGLNTVPANHAAVVDLIDALNNAVRALDVGSGNFGRGGLSWSWRLSNEETVGDQRVWAVVARFEGRG